MYFETPRYAHHTSGAFMLNAIVHNHFPLLPFFRQTMMTMNVALIYFAIILYKKFAGLAFKKDEFYKITLLLLQVIALAFLLGLGNNTGRYFYMLLPFILLLMGDEVKELIEDKE